MRVGVRELQTQTSEVLREVAERRKPVDVTRRGRVIARIVPVEGLTTKEAAVTRRVLAELDKLAAEIGAEWPDGVSAVDAVREER